MTVVWPTIAVWIATENDWDQVRFTAVPGWVRVQVPLNQRYEALSHLAIVTRAAVEQATGISPYERAHAALHSADPPYRPEMQYRRAWPALPIIAYRNRHGVVRRPVIGARKHAEMRSTTAYTRGARVVPYPSELAVIQALDAAVREATCQVTGCDSFDEALAALNKSKPPKKRNAGERGWRSEPIWGEVPDWSYGGPHTVSGGLPGLGKNRRH
jgi:hypothetical protein